MISHKTTLTVMDDVGVSVDLVCIEGDSFPVGVTWLQIMFIAQLNNQALMSATVIYTKVLFTSRDALV